MKEKVTIWKDSFYFTTGWLLAKNWGNLNQLPISMISCTDSFILFSPVLKVKAGDARNPSLSIIELNLNLRI